MWEKGGNRLCLAQKHTRNIWTFDSKGELLLTIMSSLAQEESRSISKNVTWGQRKRFADGKVTVPFKRFLGSPHLYEQRIKELFLEAASILMEKREEVIGDCRAVMEALADCSAIDTEMEAVSSEMEVTAGLIQKRTPPGNLTSTTTAKSMTGMPAGMPLWRAGWTAWKKSGRGRRSSTTFSADSLQGSARLLELPVDFNERLFHRLVDYATVYPDGRGFLPSAMAWKSAQRFDGGGQVPGSIGYPARCFCVWKFVKN